MSSDAAHAVGVSVPRFTVASLRRDALVRNSFFLMLTTGVSAAAGFVFWIVVARLYSVVDVGRATSLLSVVTLLCYFSQFGLSSSLVRSLPTTEKRAEHVGSALTVVAVTGVLVALGFAVLVPFAAPQLSFVTGTWARIALFAVLAMCAAQNLLTDAVFVALRAARYNLLIDGVLMGVAKLVLPLLLVSAGAFGIFTANTAASAIAAVASVVIIRRRLGIRFRFAVSRSVLRATLRYSLGNYLSSCLNLVPLLVIPLLILHRLGAACAAAYFVAFQIANLVNAAPFAVGEALFAEGSHEQESLGRLAARSAALTVGVTTPAVCVTVLLADPVLALFGRDYAIKAHGALIVLALSAFAVAFNTWSSFLLKVTRQLGAMTTSNALYVVTTVLLAVIGSRYGLVWIAGAWGAGNLVSGIVAAVALLARRRHPVAQRVPDPPWLPMRGVLPVADSPWLPMRGLLFGPKEEGL